MPAIKKRITAEYLEREQQRSEQNGRAASEADEENVAVPPAAAPAVAPSSPLKRKANMLKDLDCEVLMEKRKRTLPPAEQKLDLWLIGNLETKAESTLSVMKLYQFYTDMCQQDSSLVVEMDVFKNMLHNKFGKEFGLREDSAYNGLVKESKPRKKPVVAPSLGYKLKDLIEEALKSSGNPSKGVMFAWVKKYIAAKYPALQIELKPHILKKTLERQIYFGKVELVKGIGFCGFYRLPGPPEVEEDSSKLKKKGAKKATKTEEGGDSAEDGTDGVDKEGEDGVRSEDSADEKTDEKKDTEASAENTEEEKKEDKENEVKEEKKPKKKRKRTSKPKKAANFKYGGNSINDVFPLAMTYMAEPKEASFGRIRKYLEKYYGKSDIDSKLKRCIEQGCENGMWDRVSGSGASGSFQLQVDSFNPEHTESLTDMVCAAIIACTEPKISSVRLLKSYIMDYHPDFNIDARPSKMRNALERAEKNNQLRRISGIGMGGSFQLVESYTPSPAVLAGNDEDSGEEEYEDDGEPTGKQEVYVVRKTKSGRKAPLEKTQLDFSATHQRRAPAGGRNQRKPASKKRTYADESSEEEESSSSEEEEEEQQAYTPRPSKSRGGSSPAPKKAAARAPPAKAKKQPAKAKAPSKAASKKQTPAKSPKKGKRSAGKPSPRKQPARDVSSEEEDEDDEVSDTPQTPRSGRKQIPAKRTPAKRGKASKPVEEDEEDEDDYYEEEKMPAKSTPAKRGKTSRPVEKDEDEDDYYEAKKTPVKKTPVKRGKASKYVEEEEEDEDDYYEEKKTPAKRTPVKRGKASKPMEEEEEDENDYYEVEDEAPPPAKKGRGGRAAPTATKTVDRKKVVESPPVSEARTPRSASKSARRSLKEMDSDEAESEDEYVARPSASRGGKKR